MTICYLDAFSGLSGDMLVGALADAGADSAAICAAVDSLHAGARLSFEKTRRGGITATKFHVECEHSHAHRHLDSILKMIDGGAMGERAKRDAKAVFERLGEAEAAVHGVPVQKVHFHEVGAADSIADIVGACAGFELLGIDRIYCSAVNVGSGTVKTEHGLLPVPAPATARLLEGRPVYARGPELELTTPTGAAVAATLASEFGAMPAMTVRASGYGAGTREFGEHPNVLRVIVGEASGAPESVRVAVIEANIDDASPQILGYALERLLDAGALDATLEPVQMKKGRPGTLLRVIARHTDREQLAALVFRETSTLGVRMYEAERRVETRQWVEVATSHGQVRIKVSGGGQWAPEFDDCRKLAIAAGVPLKQILNEAGFAYQQKIR